jgi:predicted nucleotidyltransferase
MKLLLEHLEANSTQNEISRLAFLQKVRDLSHQHLKGCRIWVYGSLAERGRFRPESDIDLALDHEPESLSIYGVTGLLSEELGRPVDVTLIAETRLRDRIMEKGLSWIA